MGQFDKWVIVLFSIHSLYFWLSICVLGMGLTGETYKRKMVQSNLKFGLNRSISWCTEVIYSPNKKAVLDALTISLDFRTCGEYILPEYYDHLFFPTLKPVAESIPTSRQGGSSPISAGSPWPLTAIGPEHTQVQERASFFISFPSNSHFSRAVPRKKGIPAQCFSSHKSKAHSPPSGRGPDREERLEKNSQSPVVQKPWQELVGGESRPRKLGRRRGVQRKASEPPRALGADVAWKKQTSTNRVKRMCWTSDDRRSWGWKYWCMSQSWKVLDLGKEEKAGGPRAWGGEREGRRV